MKFVKAIPASEVKVGNVFYADGFGYAVIVFLVGSKMAKAYTSYGRPMVLLLMEIQAFLRYTRS